MKQLFLIAFTAFLSASVHAQTKDTVRAELWVSTFGYDVLDTINGYVIVNKKNKKIVGYLNENKQPLFKGQKVMVCNVIENKYLKQ